VRAGMAGQRSETGLRGGRDLGYVVRRALLRTRKGVVAALNVCEDGAKDPHGTLGRRGRLCDKYPRPVAMPGLMVGSVLLVSMLLVVHKCTA